MNITSTGWVTRINRTNTNMFNWTNITATWNITTNGLTWTGITRSTRFTQGNITTMNELIWTNRTSTNEFTWTNITITNGFTWKNRTSTSKFKNVFRNIFCNGHVRITDRITNDTSQGIMRKSWRYWYTLIDTGIRIDEIVYRYS